jgi:Ser/Thr protein kinase RdoA (MazF antagonist)
VTAAPDRRDTSPAFQASSASPVCRVTADLTALVAHVADAYNLGLPISWAVLTTGYEDLNIDLTSTRSTRAARYVVKVFATGRGLEIAGRTASVIKAARAAGVRHPPLHRDRTGALVHPYRDAAATHLVLVMDFIAGRSLYDLRRAPTRGELTDVLEHAVRLHSVPSDPPFVFDPWSIANLDPLSQKLAGVLDAEQRRHVDTARAELTCIDAAVLPHVLIHGDLTKGNVLIPEPNPDHRAPSGAAAQTDRAGVVLVDFAVANLLPRVQELAVVAANLCHGAPEPLPQRAETVGRLYGAAAQGAGQAPLSAAEWTALRAFTRAAAAMELLGALAEWQAGNRGPETAYLIDVGLAGLRDYR